MAAVQVESNHTLSLRLDSLGTSPNASVQHQKQKQNEKKKAVPRLWHLGGGFAVSALQSSWYQTLFSIQSTFFHASTDFFRKPDLNYKYLLVPLTTGSISSPMGLGSNSQPVSIQLHGEDTYLADSQQFLLEYALRYDNKVQGAYYIGTSCRGKDHDSTYLNQFCHVKCELRGGFKQGIDVTNRYIIYIIQKLLEKHGDVIKAHVGSTKHITDLIQLYLTNGIAFPTITLDEALKLPEIADGQGII